MTKEQEEAITRLEKLKNSNILYGDSLGITIEGFKSLQKDLEVVLNTINEKDAEIKKYKQLHYILSRQNARIEHDNMEKDNIIDLMAEEIKERNHNFTNKSLKEIKQHYERKVEDERNKI